MNTNEGSTQPLQWGIMATGWISTAFVKDLLLDPASRSASHVSHAIAAVASSSSLDKAKDFIRDAIKQDDGINAYGDYDQLVKDPKVEIIYVGTPQSRHYKDVLSALEHGKHVCCEKPMTINAAQTEHLIQVAKSKGLFMTEALWTRFFPLVKHLTKLLHEERILGNILRVVADFSIDFTPHGFNHRLYDPNLGGGSLLDLGVYPLTWAFLVLFDDPRNERTMPVVTASMMMTSGEGQDGWKGPVDEHTSVTLTFEKIRATAVLMSNLSVKTPHGSCVLIQGEKGDITIPWASFRPESYTVHLKPHSSDTKPEENLDFQIPGTGLFWEADACFRAIRGGNVETEECPLEESLAVMQILDQVRKECGFRFPEEIEKVEG